MSITNNYTLVNSIRAGVYYFSDNILNMKFTEWLQSEMDKRNWNKADLAREIGFSEAAISHIFTGHRKPGVKMCRALSKLFNLPLGMIYEYAGIMPTDQQLDTMTREAIHLFSQLDEEDRERQLAEMRWQIERRQKRENERLSDDPREAIA